MDYLAWPPFYTLQRAEQTRHKQLQIWRDLILEYHKERKLDVMNVKEFELFRNASIQRELTEDGIAAVAADLIRSGHGEWADGSRTRMRIMWRTPAQWANYIYDWLRERSMVPMVTTVFDIHSGDDFEGSEFAGLDAAVVMKALEVLEMDGKAQVMRRENRPLDENGVKFLDA